MAGSTPIYGFPYPQSTDLVADYPTLGQELATDVETVISGLGSGLNLITPTSIANSGGTATLSGGAVTVTTVASVSLNGVFTATYDQYLVVMQNITGSTGQNINFRVRAAGTDNSAANNYKFGRVLADANGAGGTGLDTNQSSTQCYFTGTDASFPSTAEITFSNPASSTINTQFMSRAGGRYMYVTGGGLTVTTAYDGFTLYTTTGNINTGKIRVYGLKN